MNQFQIVATLLVSFSCTDRCPEKIESYKATHQGKGFNCKDNSTTGRGGEWNNIPSKIDWIRRTIRAGGAIGEQLSLYR